MFSSLRPRRQVLLIIASLVPLFSLCGTAYPAKLPGPSICPLPKAAQQILQLQLRLSKNLYPEMGFVATWALQAGHGQLIADWAKDRTSETDNGGLFDLTPMMDWVEIGARGSINEMHAALARINNARPNPRVSIGHWGPPPPPPDHNRDARVRVMSSIIIPSMLIHGRADEVLNVPGAYYALIGGGERVMRFLVSRAEFEQAVAIYRTRRTNRTIGLEVHTLVDALASGGHYERMDTLRRDEEVRHASAAHPQDIHVKAAWARVDLLATLHDTLRRDDIEAAEAYALSLDRDPKTSNLSAAAKSVLVARYLRRGEWDRAEVHMKAARYPFGRPSYEAWLVGSDLARRAGHTATAARWKREAEAKFCASDPDSVDRRFGGVQPAVLYFLNLLYVYAAIDEGLLPDQSLIPNQPWAG